MAAERGASATGIDTSPRAIRLAEKKASERGLAARFVVGDALDLGSLGEQFDVVLDCGLFHVFNDLDRATCRATWRRSAATSWRSITTSMARSSCSERRSRRSWSNRTNAT